MVYIPRVAESLIRRYMKSFPVVGITGPRQSGKSTTLKTMLGDSYEYVTFDDVNTVELFHRDPERFMRIHSDRVVFDEVQKVPEMFSYIKIRVDEDRRRYGKFIVTGSSQFSLMRDVSESLAGRIGLVTLLPFQRSEIPVARRKRSFLYGCYPELVTRNYRLAQEWYASYLDTYLNRDVRSLSNVGDLRDFQRCIRLLAGRAAQLLNMSDIARDVGVSVPTIKRWISILEASYIIFLLPPYFKSYARRVIKSPKVFFYDSGLLAFLLGIESEKQANEGFMSGYLFENYVVSEVLKRERHAGTFADLYYYRTNHGVEIDLIVDRKGRQELVEIKLSETFRADMIKSIESVMTKNQRGVLVYKGASKPFTDSIVVKNYEEFLSIA